MCDQLKSYVFILGGMSIIGTFLVQIGNYLTYYNSRSREWERATIYLTSDTCTDPFLRSQLGPFNLCEIGGHFGAHSCHACSVRCGTRRAPLWSWAVPGVFS